jgi:hypothetical protein
LLRDFASSGDPVAAEAREELFRIVTAMRGKHASRCATFFCDEGALGKPAYIVVTNYVAIGSQSNVTEFRYIRRVYGWVGRTVLTANSEVSLVGYVVGGVFGVIIATILAGLLKDLYSACFT